MLSEPLQEASEQPAIGLAQLLEIAELSDRLGAFEVDCLALCVRIHCGGLACCAVFQGLAPSGAAAAAQGSAGCCLKLLFLTQTATAGLGFFPGGSSHVARGNVEFVICSLRELLQCVGKSVDGVCYSDSSLANLGVPRAIV